MYALVRKKKVITTNPMEALLKIEATKEGDRVLPVEVVPIKDGHVDTREKGRWSIQENKAVYTRRTRRLSDVELHVRRTRNRASAYPEVGEQLDAIWKILANLPYSVPIPEEARAVMLRVQAVKKENP